MSISIIYFSYNWKYLRISTVSYQFHNIEIKYLFRKEFIFRIMEKVAFWLDHPHYLKSKIKKIWFFSEGHFLIKKMEFKCSITIYMKLISFPAFCQYSSILDSSERKIRCRNRPSCANLDILHINHRTQKYALQ